MKIKNLGSFSLELIAIVVCVILVAILALRTFGGQISSTIHDSTNTVESVTSDVLNRYNGGGSGGGSTPAPTVYEYYKSTMGNGVITKSAYEGFSESIQANFVGWEGDVYQHTAEYTNAINTYHETELNTNPDTMLYGYDVYNGSTLVEGCVYSTYIENGGTFPPNPSRTVQNRTELSVTHTKLQ